MNVKNYYDKEAERYVEKFSKGLFGLIREKEKEAVFELLDPQIGEEILDAGCGAGFYSVPLKNIGSKPFGIDISPKMIERIKACGIDGRVCNIEVFELDEKYEKILCTGVLEFCDSPQSALNNLRKHLREGGAIVILYPRLSLGGIIYKIYHLLFSRVSLKLFLLNDFDEMARAIGLSIDRVGRKNVISQAIRLKK